MTSSQGSSSTIKGRVAFSTRKLLHPMASLRLAIVTMIGLGILTAWGTIVEADYDTATAHRLVFHSPWMFALMALLAVNLSAVMVDRWPWKRRHVGFILAHIGILLLLLGAVITARFGIDGSMTFGIGESQQAVLTPPTDLVLYASLDGSRYSKLYEQNVDFFSLDLKKSPLQLSIPAGELRIVEFLPYALREEKITPTPDDDWAGAAVRFQIENPNVNLSQWLLQSGPGTTDNRNLGPASVFIGPSFPPKAPETNAIYLKPQSKGSEWLEYRVYRQKKQTASGRLRAGELFETGWMGLKFRVLSFLPRARQIISYRALDRPTPITSQALRIIYKRSVEAPEKQHWLGQNSVVKLFSDDSMYVLSFGSRRMPLGFSLKLKDFRVGKYPGTMRAASYESLVVLPNGEDRLISMNDPLKLNGYTFYQASFESDDSGRPVASVLSVNRDPGRWLKYIGSLIITFGIVHLFYFRRTAQAKKG